MKFSSITKGSLFTFALLTFLFLACQPTEKSGETTITHEVYQEQSSLIETIAKVKSNDVSIYDAEDHLLGSGVLLNSGQILTVAHLIDEKEGAFYVKVNSSDSFGFKLEKIDIAKDLALLKRDFVDGRAITTSNLSFNENLELGQRLIAIGVNFQLPGSVVEGIISGLNRDLSAYGKDYEANIPLKNLLQLDMNLTSGMSGAPVFNLNGDLVGIITAISKDRSGLGLAIPASDIKEFLEK